MPSNKDIALFYYAKLENQANRYRCVCGVERTKPPSSGWGNLTTHVLTSHPDYAREMTSVFPHTVTPKTRTVFRWMEWVILKGVSFSFVENELKIKYSRLENYRKKTFIKYLALATERVEKRIADDLPSKSAVTLDRWSDTATSTHFMGIYAR